MNHLLTIRTFPKERNRGICSFPSFASVESNFSHWKATFAPEGCLPDFKTTL